MMSIIALAALLSVARGSGYDDVGGEKKVATSNVILASRGAEVYHVPETLSGGAADGFEKLRGLANELLSIMATEGGAANPAGAAKFGPALQKKIRDFIGGVQPTRSFVYQPITLGTGVYCSVTATTRWAAMLEAAFVKSGRKENTFREQFPELGRWAKSSNRDTRQWAYVLPLFWEERFAKLFPVLEAWDGVMQELEEALPAVQTALNAKMGRDGTTMRSFLTPMFKYILKLPAEHPTGGWEVKVHVPMNEVVVGDVVKKNELYTGSSLVADLIVLNDGKELMKVGWAENGGLVQAGSVPRLRVLPPYLAGLDDAEQKRVYFSSMFQVGDTWEEV